MIYDIVLRKRENQYIARVKEWPEVWTSDKTRNEALQRVQTQLLEYLTEPVEIVQIDIPLSTKNPWLDKFGWFKNDPTFDDLQAEIAAYRQEIDQTMA